MIKSDLEITDLHLICTVCHPLRSYDKPHCTNLHTSHNETKAITAKLCSFCSVAITAYINFKYLVNQGLVL